MLAFGQLILGNPGFDSSTPISVNQSPGTVTQASDRGVWFTQALNFGWVNTRTVDTPMIAPDNPESTAFFIDGAADRGLVQTVGDNGATTGFQTLSFDWRAVDDSAGAELRVQIFGFADTDNFTIDLGDPTLPGGADSGLTPSNTLLDVVVFSGAINQPDYTQASYMVDFGSGFDVVGIRFIGDINGAPSDFNSADTGEFLQLDNVSIVPEPGGVLAALGLGALLLILRRRQRI